MIDRVLAAFWGRVAAWCARHEGRTTRLLGLTPDVAGRG